MKKSLKALAQKQPDLSIVIPAYREERRIGPTLDALAQFLSVDEFFKDKEIEVLIVAADAPDKTHEIIGMRLRQFKRVQLLKPGAPVGKGRDVQYGMVRAAGKVAVFMDADLAAPLHHLREFYEACGTSDLVIGTRNLQTYRGSIIHGSLASLGNLLFCMLNGLFVEDTQCGFKVFSELARRLCFSKLSILDWGFDMELLAIAKANGLNIQSYRLNDYKHMPFSTHTEKITAIALRTISDLWHIAKNRVRGTYVERRGSKLWEPTADL